MKIHKVNTGDIIKILPMVSAKNVLELEPKIHLKSNISWYREVKMAFFELNGKWITVYDDPDKGYLSEIYFRQKSSPQSQSIGRTNRIQISKKYAFNIFINNEIRLMFVTKTLFEILTKSHIFNLFNNIHLLVNSIDRNGLPDYSSSTIIEKDWTPPFKSEKDFLDYIQTNQFNLDKHISTNNVFAHKESLIKYLGKDMISEIIRDNREEKFKQLGI